MTLTTTQIKRLLSTVAAQRVGSPGDAPPRPVDSGRLLRLSAATVCIIAAGFGPGGLSLAVDQLGVRSAALEKSIAAAAEPFLSEPHLFYPATYFPGVPDSLQAQLIALRPGDQSRDLTLTMQPAGGTVSGRVLGDDGGDPVPLNGVLIGARSGRHEALTRSGRDGRFLLRGVPAGSVRIRYSTDDTRTAEGRYLALYHPGSQDSSQAAVYQLADGETLDLDSAILPPAGVLGGVVLTSDTGAPVSGCRIEIREAASGRTWTLTASDQARFLQGGLPPGLYAIFADAGGTAYMSDHYRAPGAPTDPVLIDVRPGDFRDGFDIFLDRGGVISGDLRGDDNLPLSGAAVSVIRSDSGEHYGAVTDDYGFYEVVGLPGAEYLVYAPILNRYYGDTSNPGQARLVRVVPPDVVRRIDIRGSVWDGCRLPEASQGFVHGVVDSELPGVTEAFVQAVSDSDTVSVSIDGPGSYLIGCLPRGVYRVGLYTDGDLAPRYFEETNRFSDARLLTVTPPDTTWEVDFGPEASVKIGGVVQDPDGRPLPRVRVRVEEPFMRLRAAGVTDEDGRFLMTRLGNQEDGSVRGGLPAGFWRVAAESTLVPDPVVTPIMQPVLRADPLPGGEVGVSWTVAPDFMWWCRLYRSPDLADDWFPVHEGASGLGVDGGSAWFVDTPPEAGTYWYRLEAWVTGDHHLPQGSEGAWSAWSGPVDTGSEQTSHNALSTLRLSPNPWDGRGPLSLRLDRPVPVDGRLHLFTVAGRIVADEFWPAGTRVLSWTVPDGVGLATGVYFVRLRPADRSTGATATFLFIR